MIRYLMTFYCIVFFASNTLAELPFTDPALEERATHLFKTIRCQVCQGESVDDSKADLAKDMRTLIRTHIEQGKTDAQIKAFLYERYGTAILMETPLNLSTYLLWGMPVILTLTGLAIIFINRARQS